MKKNLTEKDLNRIVKKIVSENKKETSEGLKDTWTGVKGFFRGHGYNYSKNLSKLYSILEDISYSDSYLEKIKLKCEQIVDDAANAKMPDEKSEHILNIANNIISTIESYDNNMDKISDDITRIIK